ncbi:hypothetical protein Btru_045429 [Bulinus truncatus]|nr:hypothetical protein Btru_045429 [Bulinus truncatus]
MGHAGPDDFQRFLFRTSLWWQWSGLTVVNGEFSIGDMTMFGHLHIVSHDYRMLLNDLAVDCFLNVAIYTSRLSPYDIKFDDMLLTLPMLMLSVNQKQTAQFALNTEYNNIFDIRLNLEDSDIFQSNKQFKLKVIVVKKPDSKYYVQDSECLILRAKMSQSFGSILHIHSNSGLKIEVAAEPHKLLRDALNLVQGSFVELPRENESHSDLNINISSVFLPKLSTKQHTVMAGGYYYILIKIQQLQQVPRQDKNYMDVDITFECVKLICVEWDYHRQAWSSRFCYPTIYSLGTPRYVNCRCDTGNIFSGGFSPCLQDPTVLWSEFNVANIDWFDLSSLKLIVAFAVLCFWLIFVAIFVWTYRRDCLEASLGKTFLLPRIFSWFQGEQYLVCIVTGWSYGCGTKLTPTLTIIGSKDVSFVYMLFPDQEVFKTGSEVWFILSCSEDIGTIENVILSLPYATFKDPWHVSHILFRNLRTQEDRYCICDAWIPDASTRVNFIVRPVSPIPEAIKVELKGDMAMTSEEKHYQNLALEVNISAFFSSIVSFFVILWFEIISLLPKYDVLHWPFTVSYESQLNINQSNLENTYEMDRVGWHMGMAYRRSLNSVPSNSTLAERASTHFTQPRSRQSLKSMPSYLERLPMQVGRNRPRLSSSVAEQLLVNISMENYIFHPPLRRKILQQLVRFVSVAILVLLLVFLSYLLATLGTRIQGSSYYLMVSILTFLTVMSLWHPVFIVITTFLFVEKYRLGKTDADERVRAWETQMYRNSKMLNLNITETKRSVSYKHTYVPLAKKYIYRKHCAHIAKANVGMLINEEQGETVAKRITLFVFIIVVIIIINLQSGSVSERYMQTKFMRDLLEVGREEIELRQVLTYENFWDHLRTKFFLVTHWSLSNTNTTTSFKTVSTVRVRQIRAATYKGNCEKDFALLPHQRCHFDVENSEIETRQFALTWKKVTARNIRPGPFTFVQGKHFQTINHHYPGGGYDALYSLIDKSPDIIEYLKLKEWVDERTRAIKVEVALFNADTKLLTSIIHVYEFTAVGIFQDTPQVYSFPLFYQPASSVFLRGCILILLIFTLLYSVKEARDMYYQGILNYLLSPMAWVNLLERGTCITVIIMFILEYQIRKTSVASVQDIYFENRDSETFIDFSAVSDIAYTITLLSCILATIIFLKVILQTTNIPSLAQFLKLIPPVLQISYIPVVTILYFSILAYFIFVEFPEFATFRSSAFTITVMMMNLNVVKSLQESYSTFGPLFISVSMTVLNYIVLNYFIILMNEQYSKICAWSMVINKGTKFNIFHDVLRIIKPPKMKEEARVEHVEEEEQENWIILQDAPGYQSNILELLDSHPDRDFNSAVNRVSSV